MFGGESPRLPHHPNDPHSRSPLSECILLEQITEKVERWLQGLELPPGTAIPRAHDVRNMIGSDRESRMIWDLLSRRCIPASPDRCMRSCAQMHSPRRPGPCCRGVSGKQAQDLRTARAFHAEECSERPGSFCRLPRPHARQSDAVARR